MDNIISGVTITEPTPPVRTGYTFGGWYKEAACTNAWNFSTDAVTVETTLYAKWTINSYPVTFDEQGGSAVADTTTDYNTGITKPADPAELAHLIATNGKAE
jgi:uncharacterized repeat protein (TIGR02543 family)